MNKYHLVLALAASTLTKYGVTLSHGGHWEMFAAGHYSILARLFCGV